MDELNTPSEGQDNIVMPSPQDQGLENEQQENDLDTILQKVEAEEIEEIREQIGEEAFAKFTKHTENQVIANFLKSVNEETGRDYKDIEGVAKSIKEGAKFFQQAKQYEEELQALKAGQVQPPATAGGQPAENQQVSPSPQPLPQQGSGQQDIQGNTPATQQVQPNGAIDPVLMETRADLIEIKDPAFVKVRNEVLRVARQNNVMPDVVYNGEGLFADYDFKNRAKSLAQPKTNNVMSSTANDNAGQGGITKRQILENSQNMSAKEIARALKIAK